MKKTLITLLATTGITYGQLSVGLGYTNLNQDISGTDFDFGILYGSLGYEFAPIADSNFSLLPELKVGTGVNDDSFGSVDLSAELYLSFALRGQFTFDQFYVYVAPTVSYIDAEASISGLGSVSDDNTEFGVGFGAGYHFSENVAGEASVEIFDDATFVGAALRFSF